MEELIIKSEHSQGVDIKISYEEMQVFENVYHQPIQIKCGKKVFRLVLITDFEDSILTWE